jgi:hypothetical protein
MGVRGYACYSAEGHMEFEDYSDAVIWAEREASEAAGKMAVERGAGQYSVNTSISENTADILNIPGTADSDPTEFSHAASDLAYSVASEKEKYTLDKMLIETIVTARATGKIKYLK